MKSFEEKKSVGFILTTSQYNYKSYWQPNKYFRSRYYKDDEKFLSSARLGFVCNLRSQGQMHMIIDLLDKGEIMKLYHELLTDEIFIVYMTILTSYNLSWVKVYYFFQMLPHTQLIFLRH